MYSKENIKMVVVSDIFITRYTNHQTTATSVNDVRKVLMSFSEGYVMLQTALICEKWKKLFNEIGAVDT